jgi:membrane protein DedA with SNARE-associated domain
MELPHFGLTSFVRMHPEYAALAVFLLAFSEAIPIVGTIVPGSTLIVAISALATGADVSPWWLLVAAVVGAILGDGASFWLGLHLKRGVLERWPLNRFPQFIAHSEDFFARYGAMSVFLARFTAVVRAFVPLIAGIVHMRPRQFYVANVLSALVWAPAHVFPGVAFAIMVRLAGARPSEIFFLAIVLMIVGVIAMRLVKRFLRSHGHGPGSKPTL